VADRAVHYRRPGGYLCGVGAGWSSQTITSNPNPDAVTCRSCLRVLAARTTGAPA
jgi:hypothetical protein